ncbi:MAG: Cysteinyl-tRNA synthetase [Myxococcaceae bacterium]|nr:Cysteinyl-tRNA synthetase [Myxococcaceae bacterium]
MPIVLHDSLTQTTAPMKPPELRRVRLYVSAPTGDGHDAQLAARARAVGDVLTKHLTFRGFTVDQDLSELNELTQRLSLLSGPDDAPKLKYGCAIAGVWLQVGAVELPAAQLDEQNDEVLRYFLLNAQYREPLVLGEQLAEGLSAKLDQAEQELEYLYATKKRLSDLPKERILDVQTAPAAALTEVPYAIGSALDNDLDLPLALAAAHNFLKAVNELCDAALRKQGKVNRSAVDSAQEGLATIKGLLGLGGDDAARFLRRVRDKRAEARGLDIVDIEAKIRARVKARAGKDFQGADGLQAQLKALGIVLLDHPGGTDWTLPA